ncbi:hypothetical protein [Streptomyces sp. ECR3.8]|uniref:hypothetical protein n=1 Tax=Streptomyces sp. ECR3.8 TaxID=3461009 RepID=UPI0040427262
MRTAARRLSKRLGRRGRALLILGVGKVCYGAGFIVDPPPARGLELLTMMCPLQSWAWLWIVCGSITAVSAFLRVGNDRWGFVAALTPPTVWGTAYGVSFVTGVYTRGIFPFIWYATCHVAFIVWASRVPEEVPRTTARARRGAERRPG